MAPGFVELSPENQERAASDSREIAAVYSTLTAEAYWTNEFEVPIPGTTGGRKSISNTPATTSKTKAYRFLKNLIIFYSNFIKISLIEICFSTLQLSNL